MQYGKQVRLYQQAWGTDLLQIFFDELQTLPTSFTTNLKYKALTLDL